MMRELPATVVVTIEIGTKGRAKEVHYSPNGDAIPLHLNGYFREKTTYVQAAQVLFQPPDRFLVLWHPIKPSFDPVRPEQLQRKK